jgi:hypothetical protein
LSVLHALAQAAVAAAIVVPPTGPALTAESRTRDAAFFAAFFERCDRQTVAAYLTPDFEMYHDKGGKLAGGAAVFLGDYMKSCTEAAKPDGWRHRRELVEPSLRVEAVPGFGAIGEGDHDFYEGKGNGPKWKVGTAHFVQLWQRTADGWRLARVFSYSHRKTS